MIAFGAGLLSVDVNQTITSKHQVNPIVKNNFRYVINLLELVKILNFYTYVDFVILVEVDIR